MRRQSRPCGGAARTPSRFALGRRRQAHVSTQLRGQKRDPLLPFQSRKFKISTSYAFRLACPDEIASQAAPLNFPHQTQPGREPVPTSNFAPVLSSVGQAQDLNFRRAFRLTCPVGIAFHLTAPTKTAPTESGRPADPLVPAAFPVAQGFPLLLPPLPLLSAALSEAFKTPVSAETICRYTDLGNTVFFYRTLKFSRERALFALI